MNHERDPARMQTESFGDGRVVHLVDRLHLDEMIAGAEGAELAHAALDRLARDGVGIGAGNRTRRFDGLEILAGAVPARDGPRRAVGHHAAELALVEVDRAASTDARRHRRVKRLHQCGQP